MLKISILLIIINLSSFYSNKMTPGHDHFYGAWEMKESEITYVKIYTRGYFIYSAFDREGKKFIEAGGGLWEMTREGISEQYEFNTSAPDLVGKRVKYLLESKQDALPMVLVKEIDGEKVTETWMKIDDGKSPLFGAWRITQRERNGEMSTMQQGTRKTMKVLSGTRFQWAAFNVETREFSGTGGGTFTSKNGKYVENIEFFSRDNSRVGASLEFEFKVEGKAWHHKGLSSRGQPIYEIWTNQN